MFVYFPEKLVPLAVAMEEDFISITFGCPGFIVSSVCLCLLSKRA